MQKRILLLCSLWTILACGCYRSIDLMTQTDQDDTDQDDTDSYDTEKYKGKFEGVDLLVVVDNSFSMQEEHEILASFMYNLMNALIGSIKGKEPQHPPIDDIRVAVVSSDMGLQYGEGKTSKIEDIFCSEKGDNGKFENEYQKNRINVKSGSIYCDSNGQCPQGFFCKNKRCYSYSDDASIKCPAAPLSGSSWAETENGSNPGLATEVACLSVLGTNGCGIEQQLTAGVAALSRDGQGTGEFLRDKYLLAVMVVSDEDDCSIKDPGLFQTQQWQSGSGYDPKVPGSGHLNSACNYPEQNETNYLYNIEEFYHNLIRIKGGIINAVAFAAIVGVPAGENSPCQGHGDEIGDCLASDEMQLKEELYGNKQTGPEYYHFKPACERVEDTTTVTLAMPGRRYVKLAQMFGSRGYVYSICNADWNPAISEFFKILL